LGAFLLSALFGNLLEYHLPHHGPAHLWEIRRLLPEISPPAAGLRYTVTQSAACSCELFNHFRHERLELLFSEPSLCQAAEFCRIEVPSANRVKDIIAAEEIPGVPTQ
jgi:hypothetical protein